MKKIYEIKCTRELLKEHFIQLALYMYMYETEFQIKKSRSKSKKIVRVNSGMKYLLYNINTDNLCEIIYDENIKCMYLHLIEAKHKQQIECDDMTFLTQCSNSLL